MTGSLGRRYARALLTLALEGHIAEETGAQLGRVAAALADGDLRAVVSNPAIASTDRRALVRSVVDGLGVPTIVRNLALLLVDRDRLPVLADVVRSYERLLDQYLGRTRVRIRTATTLSPADETELVAVAKRLTGRDVVAKTVIEPELIGGVVLDAAGTVYDGSIRTRLERLAKQMAGSGA